MTYKVIEKQSAGRKNKMTTTLENPLFDRDVVTTRSAQQKSDMRLPVDLTIVSSDGHWEISEDIFYDNFPANLKQKAPGYGSMISGARGTPRLQSMHNPKQSTTPCVGSFPTLSARVPGTSRSAIAISQ
jgi:hypothetical protein